MLNILDFGASPLNTAAANDAALVDAVAALTPGGSLYFPAGVYRVYATLELNKQGRYFGDGPGSVLRTEHNENTVISITRQDISLEDMAIDTEITRIGGSYVRIAGANTSINGFKVAGFYNGFLVVPGYATITLENLDATNGVHNSTAVWIQGGYDISLRGMVVNGTQELYAGVYVTAVGDLTLENCNLMHCGVPLFVDTSTGLTANSIMAHSCFFDTSVIGVRLAAPAGEISRLSFNQCWFSSHLQHGCLLEGNVSGVDFIGSHFFGNKQNGLAIGNASVRDIQILGGQYAGNLSGIATIMSGTRGLTVTGARIGNTGGFPGNKHGIYLTGTTHDSLIACNNMLGNTVANGTFNTPASSCCIVNNLGA